MVRATLDNALNPHALDQLFEDTAQRHYTRTLLFSSIVDFMSAVVCRIRPSINAAYKKHASLIGVTRKTVDDELDRLEPEVAPALVRNTATTLEPVITTMGGVLPGWLPGYRIKILDADLPAEVPRAETIAELYRKRWTIETCHAHEASRDRWCGTSGAGCDRRHLATRIGRLVPTSPDRITGRPGMPAARHDALPRA